jgi:hypothetical protein
MANVSSETVNAIKAKPKDAGLYKKARADIMLLIENDTLKRWRDPQITKITEALAKLPK